MAYQTNAMADKVLVLGVDGFEPSLAKKFMEQGRMPALKKFVEKGSAREDLILLGAHPTVTPPMWTTLATGAYPATHGIISLLQPTSRKNRNLYLCTGFPYVLSTTILECSCRSRQKYTGMALARFQLASNQRQPKSDCC